MGHGDFIGQLIVKWKQPSRIVRFSECVCVCVCINWTPAEELYYDAEENIYIKKNRICEVSDNPGNNNYNSAKKSIMFQEQNLCVITH